VYCEAYATRAAALRIVEEDGLMAVRGANQLMIHPAAMLARAQSDLMIKATDRLGFSPVARARMAAPDNPEKDDEDDLFTKPN
jgi:P27 family predicted phage terminase small subunit